MPTHDVVNQVPPLIDVDTSADPGLLAALRREGAGWAEEQVRAAGRLAGSEQVRDWARLADEHPPVLHTHDPVGRRIDEVEFHPAWHELLRTAVGLGLTGDPWRDERPGTHVAAAAVAYVWSQAEAGHMCPIAMTYAAVPALRTAPALAAVYEPLLAAREYDRSALPAAEKRGLLAGMSMTEKQGGSDIRSNTSRAVPADAGTYRLTGHKWFTSAPMCDLFLVLAQAPGGLSCFLLPRILPDGSRNRMHLQRLKDKLGNRSNASAEIEYDEAVVWPVGDEGDGLRTILEMVDVGRMAVTCHSAAGMRAATVAAVHHASHRTAFGSSLRDQPLMRNVLADLALESEAAATVTMRLAGANDRAQHGDETEAAFARVGVPLGKYWICRRTPVHAAEALECLGGNGYVEDSGMPRRYREAPINSIWEGSGNVVALDVLRALRREPGALDAFLAELDAALGADRRYDAAVTRLRREVTGAGASTSRDPDLQYGARRLVERMAMALQASLLLRHGHPAVADAFCAARLDDAGGHAFGTLPAGVDTGALIERARITTA